jgi:hypothetical protein
MKGLQNDRHIVLVGIGDQMSAAQAWCAAKECESEAPGGNFVVRIVPKGHREPSDPEKGDPYFVEVGHNDITVSPFSAP